MHSLCRYCRAPLRVTFADLGMSPISNNYISVDHQFDAENFYPLHAYVCENCFLVQLHDYERAEYLFTDDYAYFSSYSDSWLNHAAAYAKQMIASESLDGGSLVVEIASNDGYLLQYFKRAGVQVLGVEPTANTAAAAFRDHGIVSEVAFFGRETALRLQASGVCPDVIVANNVLAHVPDLNDFVAGIHVLLKQDGVATIEFPHLLNLIKCNQFDTIYHEHFSYLSFTVVCKLFESHGMRVFDVEQLATHGGSLRVYVAQQGCPSRPARETVAQQLEAETAAGLNDIEIYRAFSAAVVGVKCDLLAFLINCRMSGKRVAGYGAPAKGNTLLNYCGIGKDLLPFTVDRSPYKVGKLLPGTRIPIFHPSRIVEQKPDYVLILPWNLKDEIMEQMAEVRQWGGQFVTPIPSVEMHP